MSNSYGWINRMFRRLAGGHVTVVGQEGPLQPKDNQEADREGDLSPDEFLTTFNRAFESYFANPADRKGFYAIFDKMDEFDLPASVLDLYSEDATQVDPEKQRSVWIDCKDEKMVAVADALFAKLKLEESITALARDIAKYGDVYERLVYNDQTGIERLVATHPGEMTRLEDKHGKLLGFNQVGKKFRGQTGGLSYPWDYCHFRLLGKNRTAPYGTSLLTPAIRPWRQMTLYEDHMLMYQLNRHPDRNFWKVDTGTSSEVEAYGILRRFRQMVRKHIIPDPTGKTGKNLNVRFNPITPLEDVVVGVRRDSQTAVEKLTGSANALDMAPYDRAVNRFFSAVRAPKAFFGFEGEINAKATLTNQDIRYARGVRKLQRAVRAGVTHLLAIQYSLLATSDTDTTYDYEQKGKEYTVQMGPISYLEELERLEVMQIRQNVGLALIDSARDNPVFRALDWTHYILREVMKMPEKEIERVLATQAEYKKAQAMMMQMGPMGGGPGFVPSQDNPLGDPQAIESAKPTTGDLTDKDKRLLSEAIKNNPQLRRTIEEGRALWSDDDSHILPPSRTIMPSRAAGKLTDDIEDVEA